MKKKLRGSLFKREGISICQLKITRLSTMNFNLPNNFPHLFIILSYLSIVKKDFT